MTREEIKEAIFDDLIWFLEETGATNAVTPEEIAALLDEAPGRVKGCMKELIDEGVLETVKVEGETRYQFTEDTVEEILDEMRDSGWEPPEDDDE